MDVSDAMALLYLLGRADVEVIAIVVDGDGEARCPRGATNALSLAALAGKPDIPVGCGRPRPLKGTHAFPKGWRDGTDNLWGLPAAGEARAPAGRVRGASVPSGTPVGPGPCRRVDARAADRARRRSSPRRASLSAKIRSVTMMGGAVGVPGNITWPPTIKNPHAEWNFYVDPTAANVVFRSGLPITLVPLDATNDVPMNAAVAARLGRSPSAAFVRRLIKLYAPLLEMYFWDQLAPPSSSNRPSVATPPTGSPSSNTRARRVAGPFRPPRALRSASPLPPIGPIRKVIRLDPALTALLERAGHSQTQGLAGPGTPSACLPDGTANRSCAVETDLKRGVSIIGFDKQEPRPEGGAAMKTTIDNLKTKATAPAAITAVVSWPGRLGRGPDVQPQRDGAARPALGLQQRD